MILLSAGHNPTAKGACHNGFCEYDEAVKWVDRLKALLQPRISVGVVPTGTLKAKVNFINTQSNVDLAIEVHFNSDESKQQSGSETLYCPGSVKGERSARIVQDAVSSLLGPNRGVKEGWYRQDKPGRIDYRGDTDGDEDILDFLEKTNCVALILEPEFIYNRLVVESLRDVVCEVLADSFIDVIQTLKGGK